MFIQHSFLSYTPTVTMNIFENIFTDYKSQLQNSQNENKQLIDELNIYKTKLQISQEENKGLKTELGTYKNILQISQDKQVILLNEITAYQDENRQLAHKLSICKAHLAELKNKMK
jgi:hypothetical protein